MLLVETADDVIHYPQVRVWKIIELSFISFYETTNDKMNLDHALADISNAQ